VLGSARVYLTPATFAAYELLVPNLRWYVSLSPSFQVQPKHHSLMPHQGSSSSVKHWGTKPGYMP
jgi:hypothetical protein